MRISYVFIAAEQLGDDRERILGRQPFGGAGKLSANDRAGILTGTLD